MQIWIELLLLLARIEPFQPMFLERLQQYRLRHLQAIVQAHEVFIAIFFADFVCRDCSECSVEIVDRFEEVFGELGDGEVAGGGDVAFCALLEVAEVGDGAEIFVLVAG